MELLRGPQRPPLEAVATAVINELTTVPEEGEIALVLDDYHLIEAPLVHQSVTFLLDRLPPALRVVLSSRADPPLPLEPLLASAEHAFAAASDEPHEPSVGRARSVLANVPAAIAFLRADLARWRGDPARAVDCARLALTHLGEEDWLLRQIADELVVTLATVKKHVGHILGKLAAANRTQAVARARVLGLLR
jgi:ATP/maltotriose-dependent transcriptional regulator MalT